MNRKYVLWKDTAGKVINNTKPDDWYVRIEIAQPNPYHGVSYSKVWVSMSEVTFVSKEVADIVLSK